MGVLFGTTVCAQGFNKQQLRNKGQSDPYGETSSCLLQHSEYLGQLHSKKTQTFSTKSFFCECCGTLLAARDLGGDCLGGIEMGKTAAPADNPCSSALSAAPAWEMHSRFAAHGCFFGDKGES